MSKGDSTGPKLPPTQGAVRPGWRARWGAAIRPKFPGFRRTLRRLVIRGAMLVSLFALFLLVVTGGAAWYTSRSEFCKSCHIMEPYFKSWQESSHKDVPCIKCHFPPGFAEEVRGKMLGLVQLAKYVTQSAGPRPSAEVPDASCLRSGCHETRLLSGRVNFHGIPFDHTPHLGETRRGKQLRCTSCHSQIVQGKHMSVTTSTCFLCHFKEGHFNEGLGACTHCHQIPDKPFDLGGGAVFTHDLAYERGVDCVNCHGDLIRGKGEVPHERCLVCHNREDDLKRIDDHVFMHQMHVTDHKIDCLECHLAIQHSLDRQKIEHAASDCAACHPDHHREQVNMLEGVGAKSIAAQSAGMLAIRIECRTCHRLKEVSRTGTVTWKASAEVCTMCHDASTAKNLKVYESQLTASLKELESGAARVREALKSATLKQDRLAAMTAQLEGVQDDLVFLRVGNGVHNIHYASSLSGALSQRLTLLCRELKIAEPNVVMPSAEKVKKKK